MTIAHCAPLDQAFLARKVSNETLVMPIDAIWAHEKVLVFVIVDYMLTCVGWSPRQELQLLDPSPVFRRQDLFHLTQKYLFVASSSWTRGLHFERHHFCLKLAL